MSFSVALQEVPRITCPGRAGLSILGILASERYHVWTQLLHVTAIILSILFQSEVGYFVRTLFVCAGLPPSVGVAWLRLGPLVLGPVCETVWVCRLELWLLLKVILVGFTFSYFFQYDPRWSNVSLLRGWLRSFGKIGKPLQHDLGTCLQHAENPKMNGMRSKTVLWVCWNDLRIKPLEVQIYHSSCGWILRGKGQVSFLSIVFACFELPLQSQSGLVDSPRRTPRALIFSGPCLGDLSRPSLFLPGRSAKVLLIAGLEIRLKDLRSLQTWFTRGTWILGRERLRLQSIHFPPKGVMWCNRLGSLCWKV